MNNQRDRACPGAKDDPLSLRLDSAHGNRPPGRLATPVRGMIFEMRDVFYDDTAWRRWLLQLLRHLGLHTNYRCFYTVWDRDYLAEVFRGQREMGEAMRSFLRSVGLSRAQIDEVWAACQARRRDLQHTARTLPGVKSTLTRLHTAGLALAVLADSEHPSDVLCEQLDRLGLVGLFAAVISSLDLKRTKPDAACYQAALHALALPSAQVVYVSHDAEELAGATRAGLQTAAFNYAPEARADVFVTRFEELLEVVGARAPHAAA